MILAILLAGCTELPIIDTCNYEGRLDLEPDEASPFGLSAADLSAERGDVDHASVLWTGKHSQTPAGDEIDIAYGEISNVVFDDWSPTEPQYREACEARVGISFERVATLSSEDGGFSGVGTATFTQLGDEALSVEVRSDAVELSDARWAEVDRVLDASLPPPDNAYLAMGEAYVGLGVDGDGYQMSVWKCDEAKKGECVEWSL